MCLNDGVAPFHPSPFTVLFNSSLRVCRLPTKGNSVQRPKGLLWGCALSTQGLRYLRHGLVLPTGISSDHQLKRFFCQSEKIVLTIRLKKIILCFFFYGDILFTKEKWPSVVWTARYFSRLSALNKANLLNGVVSASLEDEYIDLLHLRSQPHSSELSFWFFFHFFVLFCFAFFWIKLRLNVTGTTVLSRMAHWVKL